MRGDAMNNKGFALVTVMLLASISMMLIAIGAYLVSSGTVVTGIQKRYQTEVESAAGAAELIMSQLMLDNLRCTAAQANCVVNTSPDPVDNCTPGAQIYFAPAVCTSLDKPNCLNLAACYLSNDPDPADPAKTLVAVKIVSRSDGNESAIIDVVYKLE